MSHRPPSQRGPSDLQWLEDAINFMGAWIWDIVFPTSKKKSSTKTTRLLKASRRKTTKRKRHSNVARKNNWK